MVDTSDLRGTKRDHVLGHIVNNVSRFFDALMFLLGDLPKQDEYHISEYHNGTLFNVGTEYRGQ